MKLEPTPEQLRELGQWAETYVSGDAGAEDLHRLVAGWALEAAIARCEHRQYAWQEGTGGWAAYDEVLTMLRGLKP